MVVDDAAVAHDRDHVGGVEHLGQLVADEHRGLEVTGDDLADRGEEPLALLRGQHRCRLVEHDHPRLAPQALEQLHPLPVAGGQVAHPGVRVEREPVVLADLGHQIAGPAPVQSGVVTEDDVLPHFQWLDEAEVLVHHADAERGRSLRIRDPPGHAVEQHPALVGLNEPDEDLHQGRLAGPVLAEHAVHLPGAQREVDAVARHHRAVALGDVLQLDDGGAGNQAVSRPRTPRP